MTATVVGRVHSWEATECEAQRPTPVAGHFKNNMVLGAQCDLLFSGMRLADATPTLGWHGGLQGPSIDFREASVHHWLPWAFEPLDPSSVAVSSIGLGAIASGVILGGWSRLLSGTLVVPALRALRLINPGQILSDTTSLWEETTELTLVTPGLRPRTLRFGAPIRTVPTELETSSRRQSATGAVEDLMAWLDLTRDEVADLCGFSLRTSQYWSVGKVPRSGTVRRLFDVHGLLRSLNRAMGANNAQRWLSEPDAEGVRRVDRLREADGVTRLLKEAGKTAFATPQLIRPQSETPDDGEEVDGGLAERADFSGPIVRPRRPPVTGAT